MKNVIRINIGKLFSFLSIVALLSSCNKKPNTSGVIEADLRPYSQQVDKVILNMEKNEFRGDSIKLKDTIVLDNGKFRYTFQLKQPKNVGFILLKNNKPIGMLGLEDKLFKSGFYFANPLIGNEKIKITVDSQNIRMNLHDKTRFTAAIEGAEENRMQQKLLEKQIVLDKKLIEENPYSYPLLDQLLHTNDNYSYKELEELSSKFSSELKQSTTFSILTKHIIEKKNLEKFGYSKNFNWVDLNGKSYDFRQALNGRKKMLLVFWASWCKFCREEIPSLKEFHHQYKDQISIVSLSTDDDNNRWKTAMEQEKMPWLNLSGLPKNKTGVMMTYNAYKIPMLILLDENGSVIEKNTNDLPKIIDIINKEKR